MSPASWLLPDRLRRSYLLKLSTALAAVVLVSALVGAYTYTSTASGLRADVHDEMRTVAENEATELADWRTDRKRMVRMLSQVAVMESDSPDLIRRYLERETASLPDDVRAVHYFDSQRKVVVASSDPGMEGTNLADAGVPWARKSLSRGATFSSRHDVLVSSVYAYGGNDTMAFVSPVPGTVDRVLVVTVDVDAVAERFQAPGNGSFVQVVNGQGRIAFDGKGSAAMTEYVDGNSSLVAAGLNGSTGVAERTLGTENREYVVSYAPVEGTDWVVMVHAPTDQAYALVSTITKDVGGLVLAVLLGLALVGATIGRSTVTALRDLSDRAEALAAGELDAPPRDSGRIDEVGDLEAAFADVRAYLETATAQTEALADRRFDDEVFDEEVPGAFGEALATTHADIERMVTDLEETRAEAERAREESEALAEAIEEKAREFEAVLDDAADGDLTGRMDPESRSDAMADIARQYNETAAELESTVASIQAFAESVAESSLDVESRAAEVRETSDQVSRSTDEISEGASSQTEDLTQVTEEMSDLSATVEEIAASSDEVASTAERAAERADEGQAAAADALDEMAGIAEQVQRAADSVASLETEMSEIGEVVGMIDEVADRTNVLALNASIEAARAGEAGEGFAVVAEEVKSLAEEAGDAT
ncbi:MAG: methyl-accepting chemotaxis protein, partial [Haloferacaceae archaeon]